MSNVEVNCPSARCEGTITLEYEWEPPDPSIGIRGGVSIAGIVDECECGHSTRLLDAPANTWPLLWRFGKDRIARWEDAAGS
jgi:hypothetical protein